MGSETVRKKPVVEVADSDLISEPKSISFSDGTVIKLAEKE